GVDAVGRQRLDNVPSDRPGSRAHALEMLTPPTHSKNVNYSALVHRIGGHGADAWLTHYAAVAARERGEDVLILSVGDPDLETPAPVIERAVARSEERRVGKEGGSGGGGCDEEKEHESVGLGGLVV